MEEAGKGAQHNIYRHHTSTDVGSFSWTFVVCFQSTFEIVHVLYERTIVQAVVLYLECVESLIEQHIATQCHSVKWPKRVCIFKEQHYP